MCFFYRVELGQSIEFDMLSKNQMVIGFCVFIFVGVLVYVMRSQNKNKLKKRSTVTRFPDFVRLGPGPETYSKWIITPGRVWTMSFEFRVQGKGDFLNTLYVFLDDKQSLAPPNQADLGKFHGVYYEVGMRGLTMVHNGQTQSKSLRNVVLGDWHHMVINYTPDQMDVQIDRQIILPMKTQSPNVQQIKSIGIGSWNRGANFDVRAFTFSSDGVSLDQSDL